MPFKKRPDNSLYWLPNNPKQAAFLSLPWKGKDRISEALMGGGAGSGKSEVLMMYAIVHQWHQNPRFKQVFTRRSYPEIVREILPRTHTIYPLLGAKFFKQEKYWVFPRGDQYGSGYEQAGGMIFFGHCENEDDVHNYDGMEINLWTPDELTSYTEYIYTYIGLTRVRSADPDLPAIIRASGMPGDIGHGFVKKRFIDPSPNGNKIIKGRGGSTRIYIHTTASDNTDGDPNYLNQLEALPSEAERRAKKYGDWSTYEGQVFDEFREKHYASEPENALHVVPQFIIPDHWPRIVAIDWGFSALCSVGWGAINPNRRLYVYRHQVFHRKKIEQWCPEVKLFIDKEKPMDVVVCHSAEQKRGDPQTIYEQICTALDYPVRLGERDRIGGKLLIHEYLRWTQKVRPPEAVEKYDHDLAMWIYRNQGELPYQKYIETFSPPPEEQYIPKIQFFRDKDVQLIWEALNQCNYVKSDKDGKKKEDVAEFDGDDPYDMLRMLVHACENLVGTAKEIDEKVQSKERIITLLDTTQDISQYYRNMRKLENLENPQIIKRFHGSHRSFRN